MTERTLTEIVVPGRRYVLRKSIVLTFDHIGMLEWIVEPVSDFKPWFFGYGMTCTGAIKDYAANFDALWSWLCEEATNLTEYGAETANGLRSLVERVEETK